MAGALADRLVQATREELARTLVELCREIGAAESSVLLPEGHAELAFFASTNAALTHPGAPRVPIMSSFSGIAYNTGQTIAVADATRQEPHFKAIDELVGRQTHEFAAIPFAERRVLGILTLVNRAAPVTGASRPFNMGELRRAEALANEIGHAIALLPGLAAIVPEASDTARTLASELVADLQRLTDGERRIVHAVVNALVHNRAE
jgi:hypothetical protein